ncbi:hypothetical protein SAMD00019534_111320, partial [Acytostelium subglobosum LB1]|uniref:hypothetical protein n=1 Tax=Acytostelium subglobosum LB1 TaxID=1410327 RepID=UPI0006448AB1
HIHIDTYSYLYTLKMKSFTKKVAMVKQNAMEKMGKSESQADDASTKALKERLVLIRKLYKDVHSTGKNYCQESDKLAKEGLLFSEALIQFSTGCIDDETVGVVIKCVSSQVKSLEETRTTCNAESAHTMINNLGKLQDAELKRANDLKSKQDSIRLEYDTLLERLNDAKKKNDSSSPKVMTAERECQTCKENYDKVTSEFIEAMEQLNSEMNRQLVTELRQYARAQMDFHMRAAEMWNDTNNALSAFQA